MFTSFWKQYEWALEMGHSENTQRVWYTDEVDRKYEREREQKSDFTVLCANAKKMCWSKNDWNHTSCKVHFRCDTSFRISMYVCGS